jgi:hypothetical protein
MRCDVTAAWPISFSFTNPIPFLEAELKHINDWKKVLSHDFFLISCFHHMKLHLHQIFTFLISLMLLLFFIKRSFQSEYSFSSLWWHS